MSARPRERGLGLLSNRTVDDDPLATLANLFEVGIVFALGFLVALLSAMNLVAALDPEAAVTVTVERPDGLEVTVRKGDQVTVRRLGKEVGAGNGTRIGAAYRLEDGSVVYVSDDDVEGR